MNFTHIDNFHVNPAAVELIEQNGSEVCIYLRSGVKLDIPDLDAKEVLDLLGAGTYPPIDDDKPKERNADNPWRSLPEGSVRLVRTAYMKRNHRDARPAQWSGKEWLLFGTTDTWSADEVVEARRGVFA